MAKKRHSTTPRDGQGSKRRSIGRRPSPKQQQANAVRAALDEGDAGALEELAFQRHGFCSADLRRAVWLLLLGLTPGKASGSSWRAWLQDLDRDGKDARVIRVDVQRSVYSWDVHTGMAQTARDRRRVQLSELMHAILNKHSDKLNYFQGFHDIALVFLEVANPAQAFHMVERLALFHLSDQLCWPFERGLLPLLGALFRLLELLDAPLAEALREADCAEVHFAVPWVLTWFAHSLPRLHDQVMRLYDCLLASHPTMILYFVAAVLTMHRETIMATPREMPEMVMAIQGLPLRSIDADEWAAVARRLAQQVPPDELLARLPLARLRALPLSCPMLHFPHPWRGRCREVDVCRLAPCYTGARSRKAGRLWRLFCLLGLVLRARARRLPFALLAAEAHDGRPTSKPLWRLLPAIGGGGAAAALLALAVSTWT